MGNRARQFKAAAGEKETLTAVLSGGSFDFPAVWPARTWMEFVVRRSEGRVETTWLYQSILGDQYEAVLDAADSVELETLTTLLLSVYAGVMTVEQWAAGDEAPTPEEVARGPLPDGPPSPG